MVESINTLVSAQSKEEALLKFIQSKVFKDAFFVDGKTKCPFAFEFDDDDQPICDRTLYDIEGNRVNDEGWKAFFEFMLNREGYEDLYEEFGVLKIVKANSNLIL